MGEVAIHHELESVTMSNAEQSVQTRREWLVVAALTLVSAALRFWGLGKLGLTHFDEGIYAFAGLWSVTGNGIDAMVIPYAPPGYPILIGLAYTVMGVSDVAPLLVAMVCGVLTVPVAAWLGRRTFGPGAGAAAAAFAALSMAHVAFSRKALTDAPFLLTWLLAIWLGARFLERPRLGRSIVFGWPSVSPKTSSTTAAVAGVIGDRRGGRWAYSGVEKTANPRRCLGRLVSVWSRQELRHSSICHGTASSKHSPAGTPN